MNELKHLVEAVRERLSEDDRQLLRSVYFPASPKTYDNLFDRTLERLKADKSAEPEGRRRRP